MFVQLKVRFVSCLCVRGRSRMKGKRMFRAIFQASPSRKHNLFSSVYVNIFYTDFSIANYLH